MISGYVSLYYDLLPVKCMKYTMFVMWSSLNNNIFCTICLFPEICGSKVQCENGGKCVPDGTSYKCNCSTGFSGKSCKISEYV